MARPRRLGRGIAGIVDGYGPEAAGIVGAPRASSRRSEHAAPAARHRHAHRVERLVRTHGDFHPFNLLVDGDAIVLLDTSRGSVGEAADDLAALAINFLFFALEHRAGWASGLGLLWDAFFDAYAEARPDPGLFDVIAPFFAWRGLVVTSPAWYPGMSGEDRDRILGFVERALAAVRFDPAMGHEAMR
ncbi:MAG: phosphotransferase [Sandaracinus sp.]